jgi:hypothetical protein
MTPPQQEPDIIGSLDRAHEHLETAAKWMVLGGNPVEPEELAARLRSLGDAFSLALDAVYPWPWAGWHTELEDDSRRASKLAGDLRCVLAEMAKKVEKKRAHGTDAPPVRMLGPRDGVGQ